MWRLCWGRPLFRKRRFCIPRRSNGDASIAVGVLAVGANQRADALADAVDGLDRIGRHLVRQVDGRERGKALPRRLCCIVELAVDGPIEAAHPLEL